MKNKLIIIAISVICAVILILPFSFDKKEINVSNQNDNTVETTNDKKVEQTIIEDNSTVQDNEETVEDTEEIENISTSTNSEEPKTNDNKETSSSTNKVDTNKPNNNTPIVNNNANNTTTVEKEETEVPKEKTLREQNMELIQEIQSIYGYKVSYGDEDFWYGGTASTKLTDETKANKALKELKNVSAIFPSGFFRTFQGYNGFRIILFEYINGAAGVASYEFGDDNLIAVDVNSGFLGRVFYHETYHIMEQYIKYKTYNQTFPFETWNSYNPNDFNYGDTGITYTGYDLGSNYSYANPSLIAFVSEYAKTNPGEDRAELFADLMFRPIKKEYMNNGFAINEKAKYMATVLRNYFPNSVGAYWERHISW